MDELRYFEHFRFGETFTTGWAEVRPDEAISFALANDPQDFHTDSAAGARHPLFRGLSATGFYTLVVTHRLVLSERLG